MLGHNPYYNQHMKKYVSVFGTLFNDISIERVNSEQVASVVAVPLTYASKDKFLARLTADPNIANVWRTTLPRMSFAMGSPVYAPYRKENTLNYRQVDQNGNSAIMQYAPAPYDIPFTLSIWTHYYEDGLQIVEQILPFFQPEYVVSVKEVPAIGLNRDVHIVLEAVDVVEDYEGSFEDGQLIEWTLTFIVQGHFYGPTKTQNVIKSTITDTYFNPDFSDWNVRSTSAVNPAEATVNDPYTVDETRIEK